MSSEKPSLNRFFSVTLGIILILIGVVLLVTPGPGILLILLGSAVLLGKSDEVKTYIEELKEKVNNRK